MSKDAKAYTIEWPGGMAMKHCSAAEAVSVGSRHVRPPRNKAKIVYELKKNGFAAWTHDLAVLRIQERT